MRQYLSEKEAKKLVEEQCRVKNYKLVSYVGKWNNGRTHLELICHKCDCHWSTTCVRTLLKGHGCPSCAETCRVLKSTLPDSHHIDKFKSMDKSGTKFDFTKLSSDTWQYKCQVCSQDKYVVDGVCNGVFVSNDANLRSGKFACRCSKTYRWTKAQREYQIKSLLQDQDTLEFVEWETEDHKNNSKVVFNCKIHGLWKPLLSKFLVGRRCSGCSSSGFKSHKDGYLYILRVTSNEGDFTGFGVTNNLKNRLATHRKNFKRKGYVISEMEVFSEKGYNVLEIEKLIKENFAVTPTDIIGFKTEATYYHLYYDIIEFIEKELKRRNKK